MVVLNISGYHAENIHAIPHHIHTMPHLVHRILKEIFGLNAVSYTHLDVYKRQPLYIKLFYVFFKYTTLNTQLCSALSEISYCSFLYLSDEYWWRLNLNLSDCSSVQGVKTSNLLNMNIATNKLAQMWSYSTCLLYTSFILSYIYFNIQFIRYAHRKTPIWIKIRGFHYTR